MPRIRALDGTIGKGTYNGCIKIEILCKRDGTALHYTQSTYHRVLLTNHPTTYDHCQLTLHLALLASMLSGPCIYREIFMLHFLIEVGIRRLTNNIHVNQSRRAVTMAFLRNSTPSIFNICSNMNRWIQTKQFRD